MRGKCVGVLWMLIFFFDDDVVLEISGRPPFFVPGTFWRKVQKVHEQHFAQGFWAAFALRFPYQISFKIQNSNFYRINLFQL